MSKKPISIENDWDAESDFRTLANAEKIKADPKRLAKAREYGNYQAQAIQRVTGAVGTSPIKPATKP